MKCGYQLLDQLDMQSVISRRPATFLRLREVRSFQETIALVVDEQAFPHALQRRGWKTTRNLSLTLAMAGAALVDCLTLFRLVHVTPSLDTAWSRSPVSLAATNTM